MKWTYIHIYKHSNTQTKPNTNKIARNIFPCQQTPKLTHATILLSSSYTYTCMHAPYLSRSLLLFPIHTFLIQENTSISLFSPTCNITLFHLPCPNKVQRNNIIRTQGIPNSEWGILCTWVVMHLYNLDWTRSDGRKEEKWVRNVV